MSANRVAINNGGSQRPVDLNILQSPGVQSDIATPSTISTGVSGSSNSTRTSLGPYIQLASQGNTVLQQRRTSGKGRSRRLSSLAGHLIAPVYGRAMKVNMFQRFLCRHIDDLYERGKINIESEIEEVDDVDFVFVVKKNSTRSCSFRCANWFARMLGRDEVTEDDLETARLRYLNGLKQTFKISYKKVSTPDHDFYPIKLSFYHLGLMMQLVGYQWRLRTAVEDKYAYKTFYFMKRDVERYHEYQNCRNREDFSARWRYDLAYNFLVGANVSVSNVNPWRSLLRHRVSQSTLNVPENMSEDQIEKANASKDKTYSLLHLFADELFDDWLVPHSPLREPSDDRVTSIIEDIEESGTSGERCCAKCCFPCWTCQCKEAKESRLSDKYEADEETACGACGTECCNSWRSFCFHNSVNCTDVCQRENENEREFLGRISTVRNAFTRHSFPSPPREQPAKIRHILPLKTLVDYLGEKVGFYFGWIELLILSLTVPSILGVCMFLCGVGYYSWDILWGTGKNDTISDPTQWVLAKACDNYATPGFAAVMVIWGTTFYEMWHRREKWYSYLWHVEKLETTELERPPVYSFKITARLRESHIFKPLLYAPSFVVTFFFIILVFLSVYFINVVGVFAIPYCPKPQTSTTTAAPTTVRPTTTQAPFLTPNALSMKMSNYYNYSNYANQFVTLTQNQTTPGSVNETIKQETIDKFVCNLFSAVQVIANSISIFVLDFVYTRICYVLTDWEGHKTQSAYSNALVLKLFTFRFFNNYSVLFYIAFAIAGGVAEYPPGLTDGKHYDYKKYACGEQPCMGILSRQLLSVIVTQPLINSLFDVAVPCFKYIYLSAKKRALSDEAVVVEMTAGKTNEAVDNDEYDRTSPINNNPSRASSTNTHSTALAEELEKQANLTQLSTLDRREFTTEEYTEKVIVYGALLMFSVALPPAPALAILIMRIDLNLDIGRIMNDFRRPIPLRSQDIGMWGPIVNLLTYLGILTNPLIVILTSSWGSPMEPFEKFITFLVFEHIVFAVRMLVSWIVPDIPKSLVREQLIHKATKDELQSILLDAKIEQAGARSNYKHPIVSSRLNPDNANNGKAKVPSNRLEPVIEHTQYHEELV